MTVAIARPLHTPVWCANTASAGQLALSLRPPVVASTVARRPRRPQRARSAPSHQAVQLVIAFPVLGDQSASFVAIGTRLISPVF